MTTKRGALVIAACTAGAIFAGASPAVADAPRPRAVIELFTSQGCGRCPPADALLGRLAADPTLVALTYAVDYWDYLGWKDTAARPEFTQRQRAYAEARADRAVYTPQVVIDGRAHVVGSDREAIEAKITELTKVAESAMVEVNVETTRDSLVVRVAEAPASLATARATVWLARYERSRTIRIGRGENSGRSVTYTHLVKSLQPIGMWKGSALRIELPRQDTTHDAGEGCAVLLQSESEAGPGRILGARGVERPAS
ncbi:MAG: DUF1223 domain-containing protein [Siculibacillus sp.]|nr:DUF1223 domain-containing protein [Siculibacillus sp.]